MERKHPDKPFARYADDGIAHCRSLEDAEELLSSLRKRFEDCGLEMHPDKTRIIYCKDDNRNGEYPEIKIDFFGYTFRPEGQRTNMVNILLILRLLLVAEQAR